MFESLVPSLKDCRERPSAGAILEARLTQMHRQTAGSASKCEGRQRGGRGLWVVERVVYEMFKMYELNVMGRFGMVQGALNCV